MKNEHVIDLLEAKPLAALDSNDLAQIRDHAAGCESCRQAYAAAEISALLLQEQAAASFEPSPFFQTRVLAAVRERQATNETWAWTRLWRTAGGLASSMLATVATLAILTFVVPGTQTADSPDPGTAFNAYSTEAVVLDESALSDDQISDSEVLATLYGPDDDSVK
jgi:predicted anti-sigma-YlaC factor YlaD